MNWKLKIVAALVVLGGAFYTTPALAQGTEQLPVERAPVEEAPVEPLAADLAQVDPEAGLVNGVFGLTIEGEIPENVSFYVEANIGNGGEVICTTDENMLDFGYAECQGGGAINEVPFVAPGGQEIQYRILGSRGVELSQTVVSEGTTTAREGMRVDASYVFALEDFTESPIQEPDWEPDVDEDQYGSGVSSGETVGEVPPGGETTGESIEESIETDEALIPAEEAAANVEPGSVADIATGGTGLLPDTGGIALVPALGALLLAGALILRKIIR